MAYSLGIHIGHDRSATLVHKGIILAHISEERLDRIKHSTSAELPKKSINAVLNMSGVKPEQVAVVGVSYTCVAISNILEQLKCEIHDLYDNWAPEVIGCSHHDCHAYSSFYTSELDDPVVFVADGAGDIVGEKLEAETAYTLESGRLKLFSQRLQDIGCFKINRRNSYNLDYMHESDRNKQISLCRKYEQFTYLIGFSHMQSGKTMGLASGHLPLIPSPKIVEEFPSISLTFEDSLKEINTLWKKSGEPWHQFIYKYRGELAATAQAWLESYMFKMINDIVAKTQKRNVCVAGGLFLNCTMNHKLMQRCGIDNLHIIPAAGDDGQSIGAALIAYEKAIGDLRQSSKEIPYLGQEFSDDYIESRLLKFGLVVKKMDEEWLIDQISKDISDGNIVGILRGRSEIGPRALGHRSILADPRRRGMQECLNRIKGRELFRPFAPMVTFEEQHKFFHLDAPSPHMLFASQVKNEYIDVLPAITHIDGTARVQAVNKEKEPFLHGLLKVMKRNTGYPILLNTSFNLAGDPIVEHPDDAIKTFLSSGLDRLVLGSYYVSAKGKFNDRGL